MTITFPDGFLWGTATAAHQVEGGNWNNDWWAFEHAEKTPCTEVSGDAVDHYWRYRSDIAMLAELGFGAYRFSVEWSRIEPEEGEFSRAALDHYRRMIATCLEQSLVPVVTFHHFTTPRWATTGAGWADPVTAERLARFCERAVAALGDLIGIACTINEPNIVALMGHMVGVFPPGRQDIDAYARANDVLVDAHRRCYEVLKAGPGDFPVGITVAMGDWDSPPGSEETLARVRHQHEGIYLEAARGDDFVGVQAYSRTRLGADGMPVGAEEGVDVLDMGYEYWPQALEVAIRHAAKVAQVPIHVTENGIGTTNDEQRISYVRSALEGLATCIADGIDVRSYFYWSMMDNFEWTLGYMPRFGLVSVDRATQLRTIKPSGHWLGQVARENRI
ncbi:MAG TPA: glycoside hydrolase family 1 protein [Acidimicrobiia bacterium]|jgi:beta-glucosidase